MSVTSAPAAGTDASTSSTTRGRRPVVILVALGVAVLLVVTSVIATWVVHQRTATESAIQHHRGLALAAMPQLDQALRQALKVPVASRPASELPWLAGPQLGPGQSDSFAQGSPVIRTTLVRSGPDFVVAKMVVRSDGYESTLIDKVFDGGASSDACGYTNLPDPWQGGNTAQICNALIDSVPGSTP